MSWQLLVTKGPDQGVATVLSGRPLTIGRDPGQCGLTLSDQDVSRSHARATLHEDGIIQLEDLGSANGIYVNDKKISGPTQISTEDSIRLGNSQISLVWVPSNSKTGSDGLTQPFSSITIGRNLDNDLVINDSKVSRYHARIERHNSEYYLIDLDSTCGTNLNSQPVKKSTVLHPSSWIKIRGFNFLFDGTKLLNEKGDIAATFRASTLAKNQPLSLIQTLKTPFTGQASLKWLLGSILSAIPILEFFADGYRYRLLQSGQLGNIAMPEWDAWQELFSKGFLFFLIRLCYLIVPVLFSGFIIISIIYSPTISNELLSIMIIFNLLIYLLVALFLPMGQAYFSATGYFKDAFRFYDILQSMKIVFVQYITVIMLIIGLWIAVGILAMVPYVGFILGIIGAFYISIVSYLLFGEVYIRSKVTG